MLCPPLSFNAVPALVLSAGATSSINPTRKVLCRKGKNLFVPNAPPPPTLLPKTPPLGGGSPPYGGGGLYIYMAAGGGASLRGGIYKKATPRTASRGGVEAYIYIWPRGGIEGTYKSR